MKGIILAGGNGSRLYPLTSKISKHLLPVYNKPMIYYPLSVLMLAGINDILIIVKPEDYNLFTRMLQDGSQWGIHLQYAVQEQPRGIADAFIVGKDFIGHDLVCLILGDNILYGSGLPQILRKATQLKHGALIFAYPVKDPERYGVVNIDQDNRIIGLEEKPSHPKSNYAIPGIYFYDNQVIEITSQITPSERGEIEITDVNKAYLRKGQLAVELLSRGIAWLDAGTHEALLQSANFVQAVEERQGLMIACLEEIALNMRYISTQDLQKLIDSMPQNGYWAYLTKSIQEQNLRDSLVK